MKKAFRQIPIHDESLRFCVIAVWHPQNGCWKFFQMFAMLFGLIAAVLQFNRVSGLLVALARRWIVLPVLGYSDDFKYTVLAGGGGGCSNVRQTTVPLDQAMFEDLVNWLGYVLDPMKMQTLATQIKFWGQWNGSSVSTATTGCIFSQTTMRSRKSTTAFLIYFPNRSHWETCARYVAN